MQRVWNMTLVEICKILTYLKFTTDRKYLEKAWTDSSLINKSITMGIRYRTIKLTRFVIIDVPNKVVLAFCGIDFMV